MAKGQLTFLQLCNRTLQRLGKTQLTDFTGATGDTWGGLVRDFINDAQREIAKEHDWSTLYTSNTFSTSSRTYDLSSSFSDFGREVDLVDTSTRRVIAPVSLRELDEEDPSQANTGAPERYSIQYPNLLFNRTPSSISFRLRYLKRATDLSAVGDTSILPEYCDMPLVWWAVWQLQASREDSQDGGERAHDIYDKSLARAIGQDRRRTDRLYRLDLLYPAFPVGRPGAYLSSHYPMV